MLHPFLAMLFKDYIFCFMIEKCVWCGCLFNTQKLVDYMPALSLLHPL